jgi:chromosome segregation ATPase
VSSRRNIQVENPVAVLDQENAKKFLCGSGEEKFQFFKKATDLARIDATYAATQDKLEELTQSVERMNNTLSQKKLVVDEAKQKVKQHKEIDEHKAKLQEAETMYAWSFHKVAAKEHWDAKQVVAKYEAKVKEREDELAEFEKAFSQDSTTDEETKRRRVMEDLIQQVQDLTDKKQQLESHFRQQMVPIKQLEKEKQMLRKERKEIEQQLLRAQQRLNEMRNQISEKSGSKEAEQLKALNEAENELQLLKKENPEIKQAVSTSLRTYEELTNHVRDASSRVDTIQRQLGGIGGRIRNLQAASADSLSMLGPNVKKVYEGVRTMNLAIHLIISARSLRFRCSRSSDMFLQENSEAR